MRRGYLEAGMLANGVVTERHEGTPQGGPLSPLLANILLDEVDRELEKRGHAFVRYADDLNVYVRSRRAGERVMEAMRRIYAGIHLRINESKSTVARAEQRKFLGVTFVKRKRDSKVMCLVAPEALRSFKQRVRFLTRRSGGLSMTSVCEELRTYLLGWKAYFRIAAKGNLERIDKWIRRRLRALQLSQWRNPKTMARELMRRGLPKKLTYAVTLSSRSWWRSASSFTRIALPNSDFDKLGIPRLAE